MQELIERGYVYIAQPPLYKVARGKQEEYLKDDDAMQAFLLRGALDGAQLYVNPDAPAISGAALEAMVQEYRAVASMMERMSRIYPLDLSRALIEAPSFEEGFRTDQAAAEKWAERMTELLSDRALSSQRYSVEIIEDLERHQFLPTVVCFMHGTEHRYPLTSDFLKSAEYRAYVKLGEQLQGLFEPGAYIKRGERTAPVDDFEQTLEWMMKESRKGYSIQRYKGLGEMNPGQLWETTMDPETRRLMRVTIEDAISADQMFTTLMGDHVEPRRIFIEDNALNVSNLDF
jgi:DNA gyrase subunit B